MRALRWLVVKGWRTWWKVRDWCDLAKSEALKIRQQEYEKLPRDACGRVIWQSPSEVAVHPLNLDQHPPPQPTRRPNRADGR